MESVPKGKRELIIEAAEKIFSQKGFFQAKVEEIAAEAGVGKGTVYEYFSSKEEVFKEMLMHVIKDIDLSMNKSGHPHSALERIREIVEKHLSFMLKHRNMAIVLMQEHLTMSDDLLDTMKTNRDNKLKTLERIVVEGMERGEFRKDINPMITAHLIFGATISLSGDIVEEGEVMSIQDLTDRVIDTMLYGIISGNNRPGT